MISMPMVCSAQTMRLSSIELTLSLNGPKWVLTWPTSRRITIGCAQNDFWDYGTFRANCAPILCRDKYYLQIDSNELPFDLRHLGVPSGVPKVILEPMVLCHQPCNYFAMRLILSSHGPKWASTWHTSPSSTIDCAQNDFHACGTFGANSAPILCQD
jgi:hypothetical protein